MLRSVLKLGLLVLGFVALFLVNLFVWLDTSIFDSDEFTESVGQALGQPAVQSRIGDAVAAEVVVRGDLRQRIDGRLPQEAVFLSPIVDNEVERLIAKFARDLLAASPAEGLRNELIRTLHARVIAFLEDRSTAVVLEGDDIVLEGGPVVLRVFDRIGVTPSAALTGEQGGSNQDAGRIVLAEDVEFLRQASWFMRNHEEIQIVLLIVAVAAFVGAVLIWPDRRRGFVAAGGTVLAVGLVTLLVVVGSNLILESRYPGNVVGREILRALESNLRLQSLLLIVLGVCVIVAADRRLSQAAESLVDSGVRQVQRAGAGALVIGGLAVGGIALIFA